MNRKAGTFNLSRLHGNNNRFQRLNFISVFIVEGNVNCADLLDITVNVSFNMADNAVQDTLVIDRGNRHRGTIWECTRIGFHHDLHVSGVTREWHSLLIQGALIDSRNGQVTGDDLLSCDRFFLNIPADKIVLLLFGAGRQFTKFRVLKNSTLFYNFPICSERNCVSKRFFFISLIYCCHRCVCSNNCICRGSFIANHPCKESISLLLGCSREFSQKASLRNSSCHNNYIVCNKVYSKYHWKNQFFLNRLFHFLDSLHKAIDFDGVSCKLHRGTYNSRIDFFTQAALQLECSIFGLGVRGLIRKGNLYCAGRLHCFAVPGKGYADAGSIHRIGKCAGYLVKRYIGIGNSHSGVFGEDALAGFHFNKQACCLAAEALGRHFNFFLLPADSADIVFTPVMADCGNDFLLHLSTDGADTLLLPVFGAGGFFLYFPFAEAVFCNKNGFLLDCSAFRAFVCPSAFLGAGSLLFYCPITESVGQGGNSFIFRGATSRAFAHLPAFFLAGGFFFYCPCAERVRNRGNSFRFFSTADRADMLTLTCLRAGGFFCYGPIAPSVGNNGNGSCFCFSAGGADALLLTCFRACGFLRYGPVTEAVRHNGNRCRLCFSADGADALLLTRFRAGWFPCHGPVAEAVRHNGNSG